MDGAIAMDQRMESLFKLQEMLDLLELVFIQQGKILTLSLD